MARVPRPNPKKIKTVVARDGTVSYRKTLRSRVSARLPKCKKGKSDA